MKLRRSKLAVPEEYAIMHNYPISDDAMKRLPLQTSPVLPYVSSCWSGQQLGIESNWISDW